MNLNVSMDFQEFKEKPKRNQIISIQNRIAGEHIKISLELLAKEVGERGKTFSPAIFKNKRRLKENFKEMQLFVLDFDNGAPYSFIREKCREYNLPILFSYKTFSYLPEYPKYRIVFCHQVPINECWLAELILNMLKVLFPEADSHCFEVSRMFFGGKGIIDSSKDGRFNIFELSRYFQMALYKKDKSHYMRNLKSFAKKYGIRILGKETLGICTHSSGVQDFGEIMSNSNIYIIELDTNYPNIIIYREMHTKVLHHNNMCQKRQLIGHVTKEDLCACCRLCKEFFERIDLEHRLNFLIATNLIHIKGMRNCLLQIIGDSDRKRLLKWKFDIQYILDLNYNPMSCDGNCPYAMDCTHDKNICLTLKGRRGVKRLQNAKYVSIEESYSYMSRSLSFALQADDNALHLIKGQTGLGKSHAYKNILASLENVAIIALPTVKLKKEIAASLNLSGVKVLEIMSLNELCMPTKIEEKVKELYDRGLHREAKRLIAEYAKELPEGIEKKRYEMYLFFDKEEIKKRDKHLIMTHAYFLQLSEEQLLGYQVIIDEDILMTIMKNTKSVQANDIRKAVENGLFNSAKALEMRRLLAEDDIYLKAEDNYHGEYISQKELDGLQIEGNINDLLAAGSYYIKDGVVRYYVPLKLPQIKLIILSATLNKDVYRLFFKSRVIHFYNTPQAKYKGNLVQYTYYSMSRENIKKLTNFCGNEIKLFNIIKNMLVSWEYGISFKIYDGLLKGGMHFGNEAGIDQYKGKDGLIIGTPHLTEESYKLIACYLGISTDGEQAQIRRRKVRHHGFEFYMMTYENQDLREIQIYMIHSELEQCIGRSRLLRENATVYVFSNFPCEQAELRQEDYLQEKEEQ